MRDVTLSKRKKGILKKAVELATLKICMLIQDNSKRNKVIHFMSDENIDVRDFFDQKQVREFFTCKDYKQFGGTTSNDVLKS